MKTIFTQIFVGLGVMFLILILISAYFFIADPYNLKPLIFGSDPVKMNPKSTTPSTSTQSPSDTPQPTTTAGGFTLSPAQKETLTSLGIDPASVPSSISAEQEACFTQVLGTPRVAEIKTGAVPNALEFFRAKECI